jgi:hypothetical protein
MAKLISDEIRLYKSIGIDGVVEDGDLRAFLPNGLLLYTLARTLFDVETPHEEIVSDYFSHIYGAAHPRVLAFLEKVGAVFDWKYFSDLGSENQKVGTYYSLKISEKLSSVSPLLEEGRAIVREHYSSDLRVQTVAIRLLAHYIDLLEKTAEVMSVKAKGDDEGAKRLLEEFEADYGKRECEIEPYFNHCFFFGFLRFVVFSNASKLDFVL